MVPSPHTGCLRRMHFSVFQIQMNLKWLYGLERFPGFSRNEPLVPKNRCKKSNPFLGSLLSKSEREEVVLWINIAPLNSELSMVLTGLGSSSDRAVSHGTKSAILDLKFDSRPS